MKIPIRVSRGIKAKLPDLDEGVLALTTDTKEFFIGSNMKNIPLKDKVDVLYQYIDEDTQDDTQDIQDAVDYLASIGGGILYFRNYTYKIDGKVIVPPNAKIKFLGESKDGVIFDGSNSTENPLISFGDEDAFIVDNRLQLAQDAGLEEKTMTINVHRTTADTYDLFQPHIEMSVTGVTSVSQNGTTFVEGTDYQVTGEEVAYSDRTRTVNPNTCIDWSLGGSEPTAHTIYQVTFTYKPAGVQKVTLSSVSGLSEGDWCSVYSETEMWTDARDYYNKAELAQIKSIDDTNNIVTFVQPLKESYLSTDGYINKIDFADQIIFENITIRRDNSSSAYQGLYFNFVKNPIVKNCKIERCGERGIGFKTCLNPLLEDSEIYKSIPETGTTGTNYGVSFGGSYNGLINHCIIEGGRHSIAYGGTSVTHPVGPVGITVGLGLTVQNSLLMNDTDADGNGGGIYVVDSHQNSYAITIKNNLIYGEGGTDAIARNTVIEDNIFISHGHSIFYTGGPRNGLLNVFRFNNNTIHHHSDNPVILYRGHRYVHTCRKFEINGNVFNTKKEIPDNTIYFEGDSINSVHYGHLEIKDNVINDKPTDIYNSIRVRSEYICDIDKVEITGNTSNMGIEVGARNYSLCSIKNNSVHRGFNFSDAVSTGIEVQEETSVTDPFNGVLEIEDNQVEGISGLGIYVNTSAFLRKINENFINSCGNSSSSHYAGNINIQALRDEGKIIFRGNIMDNTQNSPETNYSLILSGNDNITQYGYITQNIYSDYNSNNIRTNTNSFDANVRQFDNYDQVAEIWD